LKNKIRIIVFDLGGVLVRIYPVRRFLRFLIKSGAPGLSGHALPFIVHRIKDMDRGRIGLRELYDTLRGQYGLRLTLSGFRDIYNASIVGPVLPGMEKLLKDLKNRFSLVLLSNTSESHVSFIRQNTGILKYFSQCFYSYEMGLAKPDDSLFRMVEQKTGAGSGEILFIDDTPGNRHAAKKKGWHAIRVIRNVPAVVSIRIRL